MPLKYTKMAKIEELTTDRKWRSVVGLPEDKFRKLLLIFEAAYQKVFGRTFEERQNDVEIKNTKIGNCETLLFLTLFALKNNMTFDVLGFVFGLDGSNAKRNVQVGIEVLRVALETERLLPKRSFTSLEEFKNHFIDIEELIIDGTEQSIERPSDKEGQKDCYSGKKKGIE